MAFHNWFALTGIALREIPWICDMFINENFTKEYDEQIQHEIALISITVALSNSLDKLIIDSYCINSFCDILHIDNIDRSTIKPNEYKLTINDFIAENEDFCECDYEYRYRIIEAILYILHYNQRKIDNYQDIITLAIFFKIRKNDFSYLINKYRR